MDFDCLIETRMVAMLSSQAVAKAAADVRLAKLDGQLVRCAVEFSEFGMRLQIWKDTMSCAM